MLTILNDVHAGAIRSAGTTPFSQFALRTHILNKFEELLPESGDLMILGDLFDTNNVPLWDVSKVLFMLSKWVTNRPGNTLYLVRGNHDISKTSNVMSSFDFLGTMLKVHDNVTVITEPVAIKYGYVIPHLINQDLFDQALASVPKCDNLFLHCNYDNNFAAQSDQSLNLSAEQAKACLASRIVIAHEHHARSLGKVVIPGNQIASSVSDWLSPGDKQYATINASNELELVKCADRSAEYAELDYTADFTSCGAKFIRITGTVAADTASKLITAISKFRQRSSALVITSAVKTLSEDGSETFEAALEEAKNFSVMEALKDFLTQDEYTKLEKLHAKRANTN